MRYEEQIKKFILTELVVEQELENLENNDPLIEMGIIDSLGIMKLIEFMQKIYSIEIAEIDIVPNNFENIDAIALFVERKSA